VKEVFVKLACGNFTEVLDEPSSPRIEERIASLGLSLPEGFRGEVNLSLEDWTCQISHALDRGFILTIDYGQQATDLYAPENNQGTLVCHQRHAVRRDPYTDIGQQDITCLVDFTTLMRLGEAHGLLTVGYIPQRQFLTNLGFSSLLDALDMRGLSSARTALSRIAMMTLVDPEEYGDFKVLAQAKGVGLGAGLLGFANKPRIT
jgi:SAM-dependent MidA family methyltransferase